MIVHLGDVGGNLDSKLEVAAEKLGLLRELSTAPKVFVKPNFTFPRYAPGVTTSPKFLGELVGVLVNHGAEVFVGESNGGYGSFRAEDAFAGHGLYELCREKKASVVNLSELDTKEYTATVAGKKIEVVLPRFLVEDVRLTISVPVLKGQIPCGIKVKSPRPLSLVNLYNSLKMPGKKPGFQWSSTRMRRLMNLASSQMSTRLL